MIQLNFVWCFALCALAVWRVAHLLSRESGPWDLVARLRAAIGFGILGRLMDRFYCLSFLISLPPAIWLSSSPVAFLVQWLALSAVACLLEKATQGRLCAYSVSEAYLDKVISG